LSSTNIFIKSVMKSH